MKRQALNQCKDHISDGYKYAGVVVRNKFEDTEVGVPQGGPLSPLLSNIMLNELDKELEKRGHRFARYADDSAPRTAPVLEADAMMMMEEGPPNSVCRN